MNKYIKLIKNSGIFFIGNFGSKLLSFLLVPYYTHVLSTEEYGTADIIQTTVIMLMPLLTFSIAEAALRFAMDKAVDKRKVLTNSLVVLFAGSVLLLCACPLLNLIPVLNDYLLVFYISMVTCGLNLILSQYCRGAGYVKEFAIGGIISTAALVFSNILLLLYFKLGVTGYLVSTIASYVIPSFYYCFVIKIHKVLGAFDKKLLREMLVYSIPLVPNSIFWWAMTGANKYILVYAVGQAANGIFVVAQKLPSIVNIISSIFMQSWQISAVDESESKDKSQFYSDIFNVLSMVLLVATSFLTAIVKPFYSIWLAPEYFDAWKYTTILMLANVFSCFSTFVGVNYIAMKETKGNLKTAFVGGVVSLVLSIVFIPLFGIYAAALSTMVSFLATWIYRLLDTRKFIEIKTNYLRLAVVICVIAAQTVLLFINDSIFIQIAFVCLVCALYFKDLRSLLYNAISIFKNKKGNI